MAKLYYKFGLFNKALVIDAMNKSTYYESVNNYCYNEAKDYIYPSNLEENILENVFTVKDTYTQGKNYLLAALNGDNYTIDTSNIRNTLTANIEAYINTNQISEENINRERTPSISTFVFICWFLSIKLFIKKKIILDYNQRTIIFLFLFFIITTL